MSCRVLAYKGIFAEKRARFRGKWGLGAPFPPPPSSPYTPLALPPSSLLEDPPPGIFSKKPAPPPRRKGGRGRGAGGGRGGAEAPFTAKTSPFFGENAFTAVSRALRARSVPGSVLENGVSEGVSHPGLRSVQKVSRVSWTPFCNLGVAREQETFSGLLGHPSKKTTCSFSSRFRGNPGSRGCTRQSGLQAQIAKLQSQRFQIATNP